MKSPTAKTLSRTAYDEWENISKGIDINYKSTLLHVAYASAQGRSSDKINISDMRYAENLVPKPLQTKEKRG